MVTVAYAIPMVFMVVALRYWPDHWLDIRLKPYVIGAIALLGMVFITLTVRQLWHGDRLDNDIVYSGEQYSYSLAWMLTAIGMMYSAIHWPNYKVRRASWGCWRSRSSNCSCGICLVLKGYIVRSHSSVWGCVW